MKKRSIGWIGVLLLTLVLLTACGGTEITWLDAQGSVIHSVELGKDEILPDIPLPSDSDEWHYVEWKQAVSEDGKSITYTAERVAKTKVVFLDADGSELHRESILPDAALPTHDLPADSNEWHYTGWAQSSGGANTVQFVAERVAKTEVVWRDTDGTELYREYLLPKEAVPVKPLPADNDTWKYTGWKQAVSDGVITVTAERAAKLHITWLNADGSVLYQQTILKGEAIPARGLPNDTDDWQYTRWRETSSTENTLTYTAERIAKIKVTWVDYNGRTLYTQSIIATANVPDRAFPADTPGWKYVGWKQSANIDNKITMTAERVATKTVVWKDADGKEIARIVIPVSDAIPTRTLPMDNAKWKYKEWVETVTVTSYPTYTYTAKAEPQIGYFAGNVFQIVTYDLAGNPTALGTGFVLNREGWFITNCHVMEKGYAADAIFEIRDTAEAKSYTTLSITEGSWADADRDLFVGKLDNYKKIASYYQNITLQTKFAVGDITYSVGYPDGVEKMEMHKGKVLSSLSSLADKLYSGVSYISSDSFIAPGSSGGILVNERLEVIGITSRGLVENDEFVLGASIEVFNFQSLLSGYTVNSKLKDVALLLHPDEKDFILFYRRLSRMSGVEYVYDEELGYAYYAYYKESEGASSSGQNSVWTTVCIFYPDGRMVCAEETVWENGDNLVQVFEGYLQDGLNSFDYVFVYTWPSGSGYSVYSEGVNYSENINLTLKDYQVEKVNGYTPNQSNIDYAKERFNEIYLYVQDWLD